VYFCSVSAITSCQEKKKEENKSSHFGSSKRDDICQLITEKDIRSVFELEGQVEVKQEENRKASCFYEWSSLHEKNLYYSVGINFAKGGQRSANEINKVWEKQNKSVYKERGLQEISGIGDRASWSGLGGGQLRIAAKGYIFYVT